MCRYVKICLVAFGLAMVLAAQASATVIYSDAGPTYFDGVSQTMLDNFQFGTEGTVRAEFDPDSNELAQFIWRAQNRGGGSGAPADYWVQIEDYGSEEGWKISGGLHNGTEYAFDHVRAAPLATGYNTALLSWKEGEQIVFKLNGVDLSATPSASLLSSTSDYHSLGGLGNTEGTNFVGWMRNVEISNTYVPEPSAMLLLATGMLSLLAYAWRKRR